MRIDLRNEGGFTLLEVIVALAILALSLVYIAGSDTRAMLGSKRYHKTTQAALLMRGVVMDIETEYAEDGFPTNSLEGRSCDEYLPREFSKDFDCEYDLIAIEFDQADLNSMAEQNLSDFSDMANACMGAAVNTRDDRRDEQKSKKDDKKKDDKKKDGEEEDGPEIPEDLPPFESLLGEIGGSQSGLGGKSKINMQLLCMLIMSPEGSLLLQSCGLPPIEQLMSNFLMMAGFFPMLIEKAAESTRKLKVRLSWNWDSKSKKEMEITTFIVGIPMEQLETMDALGAEEALESAVTGSGSSSGGK